MSEGAGEDFVVGSTNGTTPFQQEAALKAQARAARDNVERMNIMAALIRHWKGSAIALLVVGAVTSILAQM